MLNLQLDKKTKKELIEFIERMSGELKEGFDWHESFMVHLCKMLNIPYELSDKMDVLHAVADLQMKTRYKEGYRRELDLRDRALRKRNNQIHTLRVINMQLKNRVRDLETAIMRMYIEERDKADARNSNSPKA